MSFEVWGKVRCMGRNPMGFGGLDAMVALTKAGGECPMEQKDGFSNLYSASVTPELKDEQRRAAIARGCGQCPVCRLVPTADNILLVP